MMWLLMFLDIVALVVLSLAHFGIAFPAYMLFLSGIYLIGKWLVFRDLMSSLDLIAGIYIILVLLFHISTFMYYLILAWFMYKVIFTVVTI